MVQNLQEKPKYLVKWMLVRLCGEHILDGFSVRIQDAHRLVHSNEVSEGRRGVCAGEGDNVL